LQSSGQRAREFPRIPQPDNRQSFSRADFLIDRENENRASFTLLRDVVSANLAHPIKVSSLVEETPLL
jgi:hypothetical protein